MNEIIQPGAQLEKLADGFLFTEGPAADAKGNVYFTDQPNDRIMVWSLSRRLPAKYQDKPLNGPNDLWNTPHGGVYFTDPFYKRTWWDHNTMPQVCQAVYYLEPDHKTIIRVIDDLVQPNGIVGTPDSKTLFIADIGGKKTWSYTINKDGSLVNKKLFCEMGSDGMTIDTDGNIYLTGKGVTIFDKNGVQIGNIAVPEDWTANVCFGGKDMKSLFITASKSLYRIRTQIKGAY